MTLSNSSAGHQIHVRERNRGAIRDVFHQVEPSAEEARIDKFEVLLTAELVGSREVLNEYVDHLNDEAEAIGLGGIHNKLFNHFGHQGYKRRAIIRYGCWTVTGGATFQIRSDGGRLTLRLKLNTTRTAQHALSVNGYEGLNNLSAREFFRRRSEVAEETIGFTLNRADNALLGTQRLGGMEASARFSRWQLFLRTYEQKLIELIHETFLPPELGFEPGERSGGGRLPSGPIGISFNWATLTLTQAEVYWERAHPSAMSFSRQLSERLFNAAPSAQMRRYPSEEPDRITREGDSILIAIPQRSDLDLIIYAKTRDRVRFEMRYRKSLTQTLRRRPITSSESPLLPWFDRLHDHASEALQWEEIRSLMPQGLSSDPIDLFTAFVDGVRLACEDVGRVEDYATVLTFLLESGGMSAGGEMDPQGSLIRALEKRKLLLRVRVRSRGRNIPRRWMIHPKYEPLLTRLNGIVETP